MAAGALGISVSWRRESARAGGEAEAASGGTARESDRGAGSCGLSIRSGAVAASRQWLAIWHGLQCMEARRRDKTERQISGQICCGGGDRRGERRAAAQI
ncbi:hypothetical protein ACJRO7_000717 [Eucalyptus globulus]|uniref:Uncharacterized protein n=1 Tax=Eucalyptus globulus TaxID=34317 RepID=A0ABD3LNJ4_EUCGL